MIVCADHSQTEVSRELNLIEAFAERWRVLRPSPEREAEAEVAVSPCARAANVYVLADGRHGRRVHEGARDLLGTMEGVDVVAWLADADGAPLLRADTRPAAEAAEAVVERGGRQLRFRPGSAVLDERSAGWDLDGDTRVLEAHSEGGRFRSSAYPDALARLWAALCAPNAGDVLLSLAEGYECVDWGGASHIGGGSHGSLAAGDSLGPLLACGLDGFDPDERVRWSIGDVAGLVDRHFEIGATEAHHAPALASAG